MPLSEVIIPGQRPVHAMAFSAKLRLHIRGASDVVEGRQPFIRYPFVDRSVRPDLPCGALLRRARPCLDVGVVASKGVDDGQPLFQVSINSRSGGSLII